MGSPLTLQRSRGSLPSGGKESRGSLLGLFWCYLIEEVEGLCYSFLGEASGLLGQSLLMWALKGKNKNIFVAFG